MAAHSFDIKTSEDFYKKLLEDYKDFVDEKTSARVAINCAMTAWHLIDWIAAEKELAKSELSSLKYEFKNQCPSLKTMQDISNGSKHCNITEYTPSTCDTKKHIGDFNNGFNNDFDITRLTIVYKDGSNMRFEDEIEKVILFWNKYFKDIHAKN